MEEMRLQKYIAKSGVASRRKAEQLILDGKVKVNGKVVSELGIKVLESDIVEVEDKRAVIETKKVYVMLNKPIGYVTTVKDQFGRPTVTDLIKALEERLYPVGRLDYDTSGLLILTNDGDFTYKMTHPSHEVEKVYLAQVKGVPDENKLKMLRDGVEIEDYVTSPAKAKIIESDKGDSVLEITIHEGKNRQVRKMCEAIGHPVLKLRRVALGNLNLGDLREGSWRHLQAEELKTLFGIID